jgi:hypothetical protein
MAVSWLCDDNLQFNFQAVSSGEFSPESPPDSRDPPWWDVLGVPPDASAERIRSAYLDAIKNYHPDRVAHLGEKLRRVAEQESKRIVRAYGKLKIGEAPGAWSCRRLCLRHVLQPRLRGPNHLPGKTVGTAPAFGIPAAA